MCSNNVITDTCKHYYRIAICGNQVVFNMSNTQIGDFVQHQIIYKISYYIIWYCIFAIIYITHTTAVFLTNYWKLKSLSADKMWKIML